LLQCNQRPYKNLAEKYKLYYNKTDFRFVVNFKFKGNFMNGNSITALCLIEKSKNPVEILLNLAKGLDCSVHNPVHHILVGSALLTAYKNAGGDIDLEKTLEELKNRARQVPRVPADIGGPAERLFQAECLCRLLQAPLPLQMKSGSFQTL